MSHVDGDHILPSLSKVVPHPLLPHSFALASFFSISSIITCSLCLNNLVLSFSYPNCSLSLSLSLSPSRAMADDNYFLCIIGAMERLWFHQIVLFSEAAVESVLPISEPLSSPSSSDSIPSLPPLPDKDISTHDSPSPAKKLISDSISLPLQGDSYNEEDKKERPLNLPGNRVRSHSSSPLAQNYSRKYRKQATGRLQKSMSCKTLGELELEEVKGFMDLGFVFKKGNICPRMMSLVPGLQRLGIHPVPDEQSTQIIDSNRTGGDDEIEGEEQKSDIMRPYLSEAWLIKRPDSPRLNLKISKLRSASAMKKLLRLWAHSVASEIHH